MKRLVTASFGCVVLLCTACNDLTGVQKEYVSHRDDCRSRAEDRLGLYAEPNSYPMSDKEKNSALLALFSECMKEHDWKVAGSKKEVKPAVAAVAAPATAGAATTGAYAPPPGYALVPVVQTVPPVTAVQPTVAASPPSTAVRVAPVSKPAPVAPQVHPATHAPSADVLELEKIINKE